MDGFEANPVPTGKEYLFPQPEVKPANADTQPQPAALPQSKPPAPVKPWDKVKQELSAQGLKDDDIEAARNAYFVETVAPLIPTQHLRSAREAFDQDTAPTILDKVTGAADRTLEIIKRGTRATPQTSPAPPSSLPVPTDVTSPPPEPDVLRLDPIEVTGSKSVAETEQKFKEDVAAGARNAFASVEAIRAGTRPVMTPEEKASDAASETGKVSANLAEIDQEIARTTDPRARNVLQAERDRLQSVAATTPAIAPPAVPKPKTSDIPPIEKRGAPVSEETYRGIQSAYEAATPEQRRAMIGRSDWRGSVARAVDAQYRRFDETAKTRPEIAPFDNRREAREARQRVAGASEQTAANIVNEDLLAGNPSRGGSALETSDFDFDKAKDYKPDGSLAQTGRRGIYAGGQQLKQQVLGMHQAIGDILGADNYAEVMGQGYKDAQRNLDTIGDAKTAFERNLEGAISSTMSNAPGLAIAIGTGAEAVPLALMGAQVFGQEYSHGRAAGLGKDAAMVRAGIQGAAEIIGEKLSLGATSKAMKEGISRAVDAVKKAPMDASKETLSDLFLKSLAKENVGEQLTTLIQYWADAAPKVGLNPNANGSDYLTAVADTLVQTTLQSGVMASVGMGPSTAVRHLNSTGDTEALAVARAENAKEKALTAWKDAFHVNPPTISRGGAEADGGKLFTPVEPTLSDSNEAGPPGKSTDDQRIEPASAPTPDSNVEAPEPAAGATPDIRDRAEPKLREDAGDRVGKEKGDEALKSYPSMEELLAVDDDKESGTVDKEAHAAATSPENDLPDATAEQREAENFKMGHINVGGLDITVQYPNGAERSGTNAAGEEWRRETSAHYGHIVGVPARSPDKEHVDVFVKPGTPRGFRESVFVVNQRDGAGKFDEPKVMIGYRDKAEAEAAYRAHYPKDWNGVKSVASVPFTRFESMLADKDGFATEVKEGETRASIVDMADADKGLRVKVVEGNPKVVGRVGVLLPNGMIKLDAGGTWAHGKDAAFQVAPADQQDEAWSKFAKDYYSERTEPKGPESMFAAIARLGGLNRAAAASEWGIDPKDRAESGIFGKPVLRRNGGRSVDAMAEALAERGFLQTDEHGKVDLTQFEERFGDELDGSPHYTPEGWEMRAANEAQSNDENASADSHLEEVRHLKSELKELGFDVALNGSGRVETINQRPKDRRRNPQTFAFDRDRGQFFAVNDDFEDVPMPADAADLSRRLVELIGDGSNEEDVDRRRDTATRKRVSEMSIDEARAALLTDPLTELPNRRAYDEAEKKARQVSIDIDGLKWINDNMGHEAGDKMLRAAGLVFQETEGEIYHVSGDEFVAQADNDEDLQKWMEQADSLMRNLVIQVRRPDGTIITKTGIGFSFGVGDNLAEADEKLQNSKADREASGERPARGARPRGVVEEAARRQQDRGGGQEPVARRSSNEEQALKQSPADAGLSVSEAQAHVDSITRKWTNPPLGGFHVVESVSDLPKKWRDWVREKGATADVQALYIPGESRVYIIADQVDSKPDLEFLLFHETLGHFGMRGILGADYARTMQSIYASNAGVRRAAAAMMQEYGYKQNLATEEVLADMAGRGVEMTALRRVSLAIQKALRKIGLGSVADFIEKLSDAEVAKLLSDAKRFVTEGPHAYTRDLVPAMHRAWHGTPHDVDKFSTDKIGTGEGAQAYGWGLYFAGRKEVAEHYRRTLSEGNLIVNGRTINDGTKQIEPEELAAVYLYQHGGNREAALKDLEDQLTYTFYDEMEKKIFQKAVDYLDTEVPLPKVTKGRPGKVYQVQLAPKESDYLDWDKPLNHQSESVQKSVRAAASEIAKTEPKNIFVRAVEDNRSGQVIYKGLAQELGDKRSNDRAASETLRDAGIPGIRYLDGDSRGKGEGHHNYVIFDDKHVDIEAAMSRKTREEGIPDGAATIIRTFVNDQPLKAHPDYKAAKAGDPLAAQRLVKDLVSKENLDAVKARFGKDTVFVPVMAEEATGHNQIPDALAMLYADAVGGKVKKGVVQANQVHHTGARPLERMITRPLFNGGIVKDGEHVMVDDVSTMGGTFAELADHIRAEGGKVAGAVSLVNAARTGDNLAPERHVVREIKRRFGDEIEKLFGIKPDALTRSESRYVLNFKDVESLRASATSAVAERRARLDAKGVSERESDLGDEPALSRAGQAAAKQTRNIYTRVARSALDAIDRVLDPLGTLPGRVAYLKRRYRALGVIAKADDIAAGIRKTFFPASPEDRKAAYDYLVTADATPDAIVDPKIKDEAIRIKKLINTVGDALVKRGLLSEEVREAHRDAYLPRLYLKHLLSESDWKAMGGGKKPSGMGYLQGRKDIPEEIRRVILGEITEPGFLSAVAVAKPLRDMALLDWLDSIAGNEEWVLPKSVIEWQGHKFSPYWMKEEAERLRKQAEYYEPADAEKARKLAAELEKTADAALVGMPSDRKAYRQIPNTARYGRLRGVWVRKEIYDDIAGVNDMMPTDPGFVQSLFGFGGIGTRLTQMWKMGKVALNPPGQIRNFVSNAVMLQLSGVPLHMVPTRVIQAWREVVNDGEYWKVGKKYGVTESTFSTQELHRMKRELLDLESELGSLSPLGKLHRMAAIITEVASDLYQFSEALFKTAKIIDEMKKGASESDAALEAQKWLFDYSLVHKGVRYARNAPIGMPFITYQIKVLPRLIEVATLHPQRFLPWAALMYGMAYGLAASLDVDQDDLEKLKKALQEWIAKRGHAMLLPWKDQFGRWQVVDLGYFFPWTYWTELGGNVAHGDIKEAVQGAGLFSGPITSLLVAIETGKDSFTGRDIMTPGDPPVRQAQDLLNYLWSLAMPPIITDNGALGHGIRSVTGETNKHGDPRSTATQAALRAVGVNLYALQPEQTRAANLMKMQREIQDTERVLKQKMTDRSLSDGQKTKLIDEYRAEIMRRRDKLLQYQKDSEINPKLATP